MKYIYVGRHEGLRKYIVRKILPRISGMKHITHVENLDQIEGKHVLGVLPMHLASVAETITVIPLDVPPELRGVELSLKEVEKYACSPRTFKVEEVENPW